MDDSGVPLFDVDVLEKGASNKTKTKFNGKFSLKVSSPDAILVFSYFGFIEQEVAVSGRKDIRITMEEDTGIIIDIYEIYPKVELTGSASLMDNKDFEDQPVTHAADVLQGRMSGLDVVSSGIPGGPVKVRVRGTSSIFNNNEPLYVVDGMARESGLEGINPEDICDIQVLKDISSAAVFGPRGANGVIFVTTKRGKVDEGSVIFDTSYGISSATRLPDLIDTRSYAQTLVDYAGVNPADIHDYLDGTNPGIDWKDEIFRTGIIQNHKLVFSKGNNEIQSYVSANYMKEDGLIDKSSYERYSAKGNLRAYVKEWLDVIFDVNASRSIGKGIDRLAMETYNPIWVAFNSSPAMEMFDDDGNYQNDPYGTVQENARSIIAGNVSERRNDVFNGFIDLRFRTESGLILMSRNGIDYMNSSVCGLNPAKAGINHISDNMINANAQRVMLQSTNKLRFEECIGRRYNQSLAVMAVLESAKSDTRSTGITGMGIPTESWWNMMNAAGNNAANAYSDWTLFSGVACVKYGYDERYMVTGTFRADGFSRFSKRIWGNFPSVSAAWIMSNEKFMDDVNYVIDHLMIRGSYGITGNPNIAPYPMPGLMGNYGIYTSDADYWPKTVVTPELRWEKIKQLDFGFDMDLLGGELKLSFDYFNKHTSDVLLTTKMADSAEGSEYMTNSGEISNKGFDISVAATVIRTNDWQWYTTLNGTYLKNEVVKLTELESVIYAGNIPSVMDQCSVIKEGEAIGSLYGYRWAGIDAEGYDTYYTAGGDITRNPTEEDRTVLGKAMPDFTFGWNNIISFRNWRLNIFFNSAFGVERLNALRFAMNSMIPDSRMITDPGYFEQVGATMPDPTVQGNTYICNSSKWVEDASYIRCENITLSYDMPKSMTKFADLRLSFSIQNLFTITGYKGINPASYNFSYTGGDYVSGIDTGTYPVPRTFTFGIRMSL